MLRRLAGITRAIIKPVQKILLFLSLCFLYVFGLGLTRICLLFFNRKALYITDRSCATLWKEAADYEPGAEDCLRQA
ncbi:MAG: hypothetical protein PHW98_02575 [Candidatus Omnitrophica bacterium]|nr:hypothetical protein [Candidatus Omnitrophota bacterium]MDD5770890.1 hypothetical protein [Candidatus Omnitrophota bacterium]